MDRLDEIKQSVERIKRELDDGLIDLDAVCLEKTSDDDFNNLTDALDDAIMYVNTFREWCSLYKKTKHCESQDTWR